VTGDRDLLPNDIEQLKQLVLAQRAQLAANTLEIWIYPVLPDSSGLRNLEPHAALSFAFQAPAVPRSGSSPSRPDRFTHFEIDCSEQPNSRDKSTIRRPLTYSFTICRRNASLSFHHVALLSIPIIEKCPRKRGNIKTAGAMRSDMFQPKH
jgi:hypothetical protein